jgi:hypothetical protein
MFSQRYVRAGEHGRDHGVPPRMIEVLVTSKEERPGAMGRKISMAPNGHVRGKTVAVLA